MGSVLKKETQVGDTLIPIKEAGYDSMEPGTDNMEWDGLTAIAQENGVEAVILESHRNWVDKSPVKSLQLSAKWLNAYFLGGFP